MLLFDLVFTIVRNSRHRRKTSAPARAATHHQYRPSFELLEARALLTTIIDLSALGAGNGEALGINASGDVVGSGDKGGFLYAHGALSILPSGTYGIGINASDQVAGYDTGHAITYINGVTTELPALPGLPGGIAYGINASGQVVGLSGPVNSDHAFLYSNGVVSDLGPGEAYGINDSGQVVGISGGQPFLYSNGTMTGLGTLGGPYGEALGINNAGQVVGWADTSSSQDAFIYSHGTMTDLDPPGRAGDAYGINNSGQVVGRLATGVPTDAFHAFLYSSGKMIDLNSMLPRGSGWDLMAATAINDSGEIAGYGSRNGGLHPFLLIPSPSPLHLVNDTPLLAPEGGVETITKANLVTTDKFDRAEALTYTVTAEPTQGQLLKNGVPLTGTFTQADIDNGIVAYSNTATSSASAALAPSVTGSVTSDSFGFTVADRADNSINATFNISFLTASIDSTRVRPKEAPDLQLNQIYSGEQLNVPVLVTNIGNTTASGDISIHFLLSSMPTYNAQTAVSVSAKGKLINQSITLGSLQTQLFTAQVTIPTNGQLKRGNQYYLLARVVSAISERDSNNGNDLSNVAATQPYEDLGVPSKWFVAATYYEVIRDTLNGRNPFGKSAPVPIDGKHFTAIFESGSYDTPNLAPYLDSKNIATVGIGLNLDALDAMTKAGLADDVQAFYRAKEAEHAHGYANIDQLTDTEVINILKREANQFPKGNGRQALKKSDAQALFDSVYDEHAQAASMSVGQDIWTNILPMRVQWVLTDIDFNVRGGVNTFHQLLQDLQLPSGPDYIRAGFDFVDSQRTHDVQYARSLAGFEFILGNHSAGFGQILGP